MHRGYIKLWRKTFDAGWLQNHKLCIFWLWCLLKASHKEYDLMVGFQRVHLMPGEFVFGLKATAKELKLSIQSIRTSMHFLKMSQNLTIKSTNKFSVISIVNWAAYQQTESENNTQTNKPLTNHQQTTNNKQECKELKECKETIINVKKVAVKKIFDKDSEEIKLSELLFGLITERDKKAKIPNFQSWAEYVYKLINIDNRNPEEIAEVIKWCQYDLFWQNNILSTNKLRDKFSQLVLKMNGQSNQQTKSKGGMFNNERTE